MLLYLKGDFMKKKQYTLDTIHCAGCTYTIENRIMKINGVVSCTLNFINCKLTVLFDEEIINEIDLQNKISNCIDSSIIISSKDLIVSEEEANQKSNTTNKLRRRLFSLR